MSFFDSIVIPPSANHILLLKYILTVSLLLFTPYLGMVMGASFFSVFFKRKSNQTGKKLYHDFAKHLLEKLTVSKYAFIALGIIPLVSILFCYAQFLFQSGSNSLTFILVAVDIIALAFVLIYIYKNSFVHVSVIDSLEKIVESNPELQNKKEMTDVQEMGKKLGSTANRTGFWGTILFFIGAYFFIASLSFASNPSRWIGSNNVFEVVFNWHSIFSFLYFLSAAGAITGSAILFYFFKWSGGIKNMSQEYSTFVRNFSITFTFISIILLPLLLFLSFIFIPQTGLSGSVFVYFILLLIAVVLSCNMLYQMYKNSDIGYSAAIFLIVIVIIGFNILKDQNVLANALKEQTENLISKSEQYEKDLSSKLTVISNVDPEQIYNTKCIACHKFDIRLVGPPYNETVPTFKGDVNALSDFIYNPSPTPKNVGYPPMPNQGLKKSEAMAMAKWLISKVSEKK